MLIEEIFDYGDLSYALNLVICISVEKLSSKILKKKEV